MNEKKDNTLIIFVAVTTLIILFAGLFYPVVNSSEEDEPYTPFIIQFTNDNVIVFSDDDFFERIQTALVDCTERVNIFTDKMPVEGDIVFIDESWFIETEGEWLTEKMIEEMIFEGMILLFVDGDYYLYKESDIELRSYSYSPDETGNMYGIYYPKKGPTSHFDCIGYTWYDKVRLGYMWATEPNDPYYFKGYGNRGPTVSF